MKDIFIHQAIVRAMGFSDQEKAVFDVILANKNIYLISGFSDPDRLYHNECASGTISNLVHF